MISRIGIAKATCDALKPIFYEKENFYLYSRGAFCRRRYLGPSRFTDGRSDSILLLANIDALADGELPDGWEEGEAMTDVKHDTGRTQVIVIPWNEGFVATTVPVYEDIKCCKESDPRNACDPSQEDSKC